MGRPIIHHSIHELTMWNDLQYWNSSIHSMTNNDTSPIMKSWNMNLAKTLRLSLLMGICRKLPHFKCTVNKCYSHFFCTSMQWLESLAKIAGWILADAIVKSSGLHWDQSGPEISDISNVSQTMEEHNVFQGQREWLQNSSFSNFMSRICQKHMFPEQRAKAVVPTSRTTPVGRHPYPLLLYDGPLLPLIRSRKKHL